VTIFEIKLLDLRADEIDLEVHCSKGTYIRSIVEDLGFELGCGAHVSMLRRIEVADYDSSQMLTLEQLEDLARPAVEGETQECIQTRLDAVLFAPWSAVERFPSLELSDILAARLLQGQKLGERFEQRGLVRLFENSRFLGLGEVDETGRLRAKRLLDTSENAL